VVGQIAGFGAGELLGAAVFELIPEANLLSNWEIGIWMLVGGSVYVVADRAIDRRSGKSSGAMGIVVGNVNDALPESVIFGIQLGSGLALSAGFVGAVWVSNIPQALFVNKDCVRSYDGLGVLIGNQRQLFTAHHSAMGCLFHLTAQDKKLTTHLSLKCRNVQLPQVRYR
jgi:hypothetical protein